MTVSPDGRYVERFTAEGFCGDQYLTALVVMIRIDHTDHGDVFYWEEPYYDRYRSVSGIIYPSGEASGNISYHHAGCDRDGLTWTAYVQ